MIFTALTEPDLDPARPSSCLLADEQRPRVLVATQPALVIWSSLWDTRSDARVRFDLPPDGRGGTNLSWTLLVEEPPLEPALRGHFCKRLNQLINASPRYTFGQ